MEVWGVAWELHGDTLVSFVQTSTLPNFLYYKQDENFLVHDFNQLGCPLSLVIKKLFLFRSQVFARIFGCIISFHIFLCQRHEKPFENLNKILKMAYTDNYKDNNVGSPFLLVKRVKPNITKGTTDLRVEFSLPKYPNGSYHKHK